MFDIDRTIGQLRELFEKEREGSEKRKRDYDKLAAMEIQDRFDALTRSMLREVLQELLRYPPYHSRHSKVLSDFHGSDSYDRCIFIMTKYPDGNDPSDPVLMRVVKVVQEAIKECGYSPRIASARRYHQQLWDN